MTALTMKWTVDHSGQWVRRPYELTETAAGKSDRPAMPPSQSEKKI